MFSQVDFSKAALTYHPLQAIIAKLLTYKVSHNSLLNKQSDQSIQRGNDFAYCIELGWLRQELMCAGTLAHYICASHLLTAFAFCGLNLESESNNLASRSRPSWESSVSARRERLIFSSGCGCTTMSYQMAPRA